jgi:hypothetical protein
MRGAGTDEPWILDDVSKVDALMRQDTGRLSVAAHWRKPLSVDEVARMAPTPEVLERKGRG